MKIKTDFYQDGQFWNAMDVLLNSDSPVSYTLLCENRKSMIVVTNEPIHVYVQVGSWTLEYSVE